MKKTSGKKKERLYKINKKIILQQSKFDLQKNKSQELKKRRKQCIAIREMEN